MVDRSPAFHHDWSNTNFFFLAQFLRVNREFIFDVGYKLFKSYNRVLKRSIEIELLVANAVASVRCLHALSLHDA
jgi:hypothetical protein